MSDDEPRRAPDRRGEQDEIWRRDFPYTSAGEEAVTRREFGRYLVLASGAFAIGNVGIATWASAREHGTDVEQAVVAAADVPEGATHLFRYPDDDHPAILLHLPGGEFRAFSQKCTHLGCVVYHESQERQLVCPCHEGFFDDSTGEVVAGPPTRPLGRIEIEVRDGTVWAVGGEVH